MEQYDPQMAQRVWERVGAATPRESWVSPMGEQTLAEAFSRLARLLPGNAGHLQSLSKECRRAAACLKGIAVMAGEQEKAVTAAPMSAAGAESLLRMCYGRCLKLLSEYRSRAEDDQFGCVFAALAEEKQNHCRKILEITGMR